MTSPVAKSPPFYDRNAQQLGCRHTALAERISQFFFRLLYVAHLQQMGLDADVLYYLCHKHYPCGTETSTLGDFGGLRRGLCLE